MERILVATDLSARSDRAVMRAAHLAQAHGAALRIVHVVSDDVPGAILQRRSEEAEEVLAAMVAANPTLKALAPAVDVEAGRLDRLIPEVARSGEADLIVVGSHRGRGLADLLGAPTLSRVLRGVDVPVLVAVGRPEADYAEVSIGWDFSPAGEAATKVALALAPKAAMTFVHSWHEPVAAMPYAYEGGGAITEEALERLRGQVARSVAGIVKNPSVKVLVGPPAYILARQAEEGADLLAVGRHARSGLARLV
ncbi:MAG: universal stress protein, partial [Jannaschia sp.]